MVLIYLCLTFDGPAAFHTDNIFSCLVTYLYLTYDYVIFVQVPKYPVFSIFMRMCIFFYNLIVSKLLNTELYLLRIFFQKQLLFPLFSTFKTKISLMD